MHQLCLCAHVCVGVGVRGCVSMFLMGDPLRHHLNPRVPNPYLTPRVPDPYPTPRVPNPYTPMHNTNNWFNISIVAKSPHLLQPTTSPLLLRLRRSID